MSELRRFTADAAHGARDGAPRRDPRHQELIDACRRGDQLTVRRLGWWGVYQRYAKWWDSRHEVSGPDFARYADALGDLNPDDVLEAFASLAGTWRPSPAAVRGEVLKRHKDDATVDVGRGRDRTSEPDAIVAVAQVLVAGEQPCGCDGSPMARTWRYDARWILRCPDCHGLEHPGLRGRGSDRQQQERRVMRCSTCGGRLVRIPTGWACPRVACPGHGRTR